VVVAVAVDIYTLADGTQMILSENQCAPCPNHARLEASYLFVVPNETFHFSTFETGFGTS